MLWGVLCAAVQVHPAPHALVREPCTTSVDAFKANGSDVPAMLTACQAELASIAEQLGECNAEAAQVEASGEAERAQLRADWEAASAQAEALATEVSEREAVLAGVEAENDALHAALVAALQGRGLALLHVAVQLDLRLQEEPEGQLIDAWLACEDEKTSKQLALSACETTLVSTRQRHEVSNSHYESMKESAAHNVEMMQSRLAIIEQMITSANARQVRLQAQVDSLNAALGDYDEASLLAVRNGTNHTLLGVKGTRAAPAATVPVTEGAPVAESAPVVVRAADPALRGKAQPAQLAVEHAPKATSKADPLAAAKAELEEIDGQIKAKAAEVQLAIARSQQARVHMEDSIGAQKSLAAELAPLKDATLEAFVKAFQLDYQLDQAEEVHADAYVQAKNSTRLFEQAAEQHHLSVAELQRLVNRKRMLQHIVSEGLSSSEMHAIEKAQRSKEDSAEDSAASDGSRRVGLQLVLALALARAAF